MDVSTAMGSPLFTELKKQASFFLKEKIRSARLALTDVTPAQLLTEEATSGSSPSPDAMTMKQISRAAFEVDDYWRIVDILHQRLSEFDRKTKWREAYKALILLEHLLTHGPKSASKEFEFDRQVIWEMADFQYVDEKGFNWGLSVRTKAERVLKLLEKGPLLKEERARARQISRGIQGFGSFNLSCSSSRDSPDQFERSHSDHHQDYKRASFSSSGMKTLSPDCDYDADDDAKNKRTSEADEEKCWKKKNNNNSKSADRELLMEEESDEGLTFDDGRRVENEGGVKEDHPFSSLEQERLSLLVVSHS